MPRGQSFNERENYLSMLTLLSHQVGYFAGILFLRLHTALCGFRNLRKLQKKEQVRKSGQAQATTGSH